MRTVVVLASLWLCATASAADSDSVLLNRILTKEQYEVLKVDSMSAEQQQALVQALRSAYSIGQAKAADDKPPARVAVETPVTTNDVIETKIDGDFEGGEGETIVKLMNGQIWQQSEYHYHYHYAFMPDVLIFRSGGGYKMKVEGVEKAVGVRRLK
jgi:hypothetical protein